MHVVFREARGLEESDTPFDPGQTPADLLVLSFSDSDLGAFAAGWHRANGTGAGRVGNLPTPAPEVGRLPTLRLLNLVALKHPLSVDTYADAVLRHARGILIRLIGGEAWWPHGLATVQDLARRHGIALAVLPADGRPDERLDALSTVPVSTLRRLSALCDAGGAVAAQAALAQLALAAGLYAAPVMGDKTVPDTGWYDPDRGVVAPPGACRSPPSPLPPSPLPGERGAQAPPLAPPPRGGRGEGGEDGLAGGNVPARIAVIFYRSYLTAADTAPVDALIRAFRARGIAAHGLFAPSLKGPAADSLRGHLRSFAPDAIVNATAFSARGGDGTSPLDAAGCPVFQVALSTARRRDWAASERGLSPADLAMHVALPEVDGRILAGAASFKSPGKRDPDLQFTRFAHRADPARVAAIADRVCAHIRLRTTRNPEKRVALILSTYPGKDWNAAHAVGLDAPASAEAIATALAAEGYTTSPLIFAQIPSGGARAAGGGQTAPLPTAPLAHRLNAQTETWPLAAYRAALASLPETLRAQLQAAWGDPEQDPACDGTAFRFRALRTGNLTVALQPERADAATRADSYHDLARTPRHAYVAFYLWLRSLDPHAIVHIGAHGTLEWLPGKAVALGSDCWPEALAGPLPVFYPFIVNDPGEAAQAKRRIGAVTLGHLPPPLKQSDLPDALHRLERLLDEYATADGLDPARRTRLISAIRDEAAASGIARDLNLPHDAGPAEAIPRIDRFVCDLKESRYGDGLHVYGQAAGEMAGLLAGLAGKRVEPGPAGSPHRGRSDVLPTGRNLYGVDPRAVPSRAAHAQGVKLAEELLRRHLQDIGDWPRGLVVDLWGSATMRTAGEEFAMALHLAGLAPRWDEGSDRVTGVTVIPLAELRRPRIDVTCRVSGLFRDTFPGLPQLFETGAALLAGRDEDPADNPYLSRAPRVFAPEPGQYGLGLGAVLNDYSDAGRSAAGEAWIAHSSWAIAADGTTVQDRGALEDRLKGADAFAHVQDLTETDVLAASDYAAHEGGFAAALATLGAPAPALWHIDSTAATPRARSLPEEIARTVRARLAQPGWAAGMMRHGFRGAAEIAATVDHLGQFAHLTRAVPHHLIDIAWDATLGTDEVTAFMETENPGALDALRARFAALRDAGLWLPRRNSTGVPEAAE